MTKRRTWSLIAISLAAAMIVAGIAVMFYTVPGGDAIKRTMEDRGFFSLYTM